MSRLVNGGILSRVIKPALNEKYAYVLAASKIYRIRVSDMNSQLLLSPAGSSSYTCTFFDTNPTETKVFMSSNSRLWFKDGSVWSEQRPAGNVNLNWEAGGMSYDGSVRAAGVTNGRLYLFINGSWSEHQPAGNINMNWKTVVVSGDGSTIIATPYTAANGNSRVYMYRNSTWSELQPTGNISTYGDGLAINWDGTKYFVERTNKYYYWNGIAWSSAITTPEPPYFINNEGTQYCYAQNFSGYSIIYWHDGATLNSVSITGTNMYRCIMKSDFSLILLSRLIFGTEIFYSGTPFSSRTAMNLTGSGTNYAKKVLKFNRFY